MRAAGARSSAARGHIHSWGKLPYRSLGLLRGVAHLRLVVRSLAECVRSLAELREGRLHRGLAKKLRVSFGCSKPKSCQIRFPRRSGMGE